ncbi:sensor histidine kinase [Spirosoma linguale]|uniref:histidine kinase n=1 Tax=Spirosoma linguale (strain ATCC 33905 / DSM 74 / LMG 10896 / Claus 1) TaxID=504472 RepID=D2QCV1_SPILD|nr:histidine kinase [Spirosoma linguale DSM 74]
MPHSFDTFKARMRIDFSVIIAGFLLLLGLLLLGYQQVRQDANSQWVEHTYQVIDQLKAVEALLVDAETGARGFAATRDRVFLEPYRQARPRIDSNLEALPKLVADNPAQQRRARQLDQLAKAKVAIVDQLVRTIPSPAADALLKQGKQRMDAVRRQVRAMIAVEQALLKTRQQRTLTANRYTMGLIALLLALALLAFWQASGIIQQELTQRLEVQRATRQTAELLQSIIRNVPTGLVVYQAVRDLDGQIVDFIYTLSNPVNDQVAGRQAGELLQVSLLTHAPVTRTNGIYADLVQVVTSGQPLYRIRHFQSDRVQGWFDSRYVKQGDGVLVSFLDVTALKEAELTQQQQALALQRANQELQRSNDSLQSFAFVASHDLQEPLRKIESFSTLLMGQYSHKLDEHAADYLRRMQSAASRMSTLIRDLLAYSRISTQPDATNAVPLTLVARQAATDLDLLIDETRAIIRIDPLPTVLGDASQLGQLFLNLLANALKFRRTGVVPQIEIQSHPVPASELPSSVKPARMAATYHRIDVADNGIGFEEQYVDRIFQVFQRLHSKSAYAGTGIGLAICEKVVSNHGGAITATSQPGQGATFSIYLPANE